MPWISMLPSVIVPVLSRHSTSTLASVSTQYISCARVWCLASLITLRQNTTDVSATRPLGIMPTNEPIVVSTVLFISLP